jgi:hypothetical protein
VVGGRLLRASSARAAPEADRDERQARGDLTGGLAPDNQMGSIYRFGERV